MASQTSLSSLSTSEREALELPNHSIALFSRAAHIIGGDYAEIFEFDDGLHIGIVLIDIVGKGVKAGFQISAWKSLLDEELKQFDSPDKAFFVINNKATSLESITRPAPIFYAIFNKETGQLRYCNAGHEPPLFAKEGTFKELAEGGFPLGAMDDEPYEVGEVTLTRGSLLLCYTDGISEANHKDGEDYGEERLKAFMSQHLFASAEHTVSKLIDDVLTFSNYAPQHDDLTCIVLSAIPNVSKDTVSHDGESDIPASEIRAALSRINLDMAYYENHYYDALVIQAHLEKYFSAYLPSITFDINLEYIQGKIIFSKPVAEIELKPLLNQLLTKYDIEECAFDDQSKIIFRRLLKASPKPVVSTAGALIINPSSALKVIANSQLSHIMPVVYTHTMEEAFDLINRRPNSIKLVIVNASEFEWDLFKKIRAINTCIELILCSNDFETTPWIKKLEGGVFEILKTPLEETPVIDAIQRALEKVNKRYKEIVDDADSLYETLDESYSKVIEGGSVLDMFTKTKEAKKNLLKSLNDKFDEKFDEDGFTALIVEDEPEVGQYLSKALIREGYDTFICETPEKALELIEKETVHIVFCDIGLPGMTGIELISKLIMKNPNIEVTMVTGFKDQDKITNAFRNNIQNYVTKPVDKSRLLELAEQTAQIYFYKSQLGDTAYKVFIEQPYDVVTRSIILKHLLLNQEGKRAVMGLINKAFPDISLPDAFRDLPIPVAKVKNNIFEIIEDGFSLDSK